MSPRLRKVTTGSGATAVQIVRKVRGKVTVLEHLGSAHTPAELTALLTAGEDKLASYGAAEQLELELGLPADPDVTPHTKTVVGSRSAVLVDAITESWNRLGFSEVVDDQAFFHLVLARLIEPTSKADSIRVLAELGINPPHHNTFLNCLARARDRDYRSQIAGKCFDHSVSTSGISLLLYDVTTLYFEAEKEDDLPKVGYSKERRVDPQIVVGLLVDRTGFPLEIGCYEGSKAETHTIIPVIKAFQDRHGVTDMVVAADAGMLSAKNLTELDQAGLRFIVGSRQTKAPHDLATHFQWNGDWAADGQVIDTITPKGTKRLDPDRVKKKREPVWSAEEFPDAWRVVWQYRRKRAMRDEQTLNLQRNRALAIIEGEKPAKKARFVKVTDENKEFDESSYKRAMKLSGYKGYVSNIPADIMSAAEVISSYHDLWHVEQSFRMSKTDLRARPIFHRTRDAIEAHLTIVFTALALARFMQDATGASLKKIVTTLRPLREFTGRVGGQEITFDPEVTGLARDIAAALLPGRFPGH
ncbi:IS1634 family transposase [Brevibacterium aurantiacum]|uniref:IS1634 family transposase n=2 Tax=Brevibacterium aurantiacum TaxID=273384 RepID=A0A2A3Z7P9_BREAU|nr:IS1634 family transposase [Brevibacterium aurantiacum]PCC47578.1 IS1634 family transposase [Brevibacterium aurantiacum]